MSISTGSTWRYSTLSTFYLRTHDQNQKIPRLTHSGALCTSLEHLCSGLGEGGRRGIKLGEGAGYLGSAVKKKLLER
jgi:hypothetical protein